MNVTTSFDFDGQNYDVVAYDFTMRQSGPSYDGLSVHCDGKVIYSTGIGMQPLADALLAEVNERLAAAYRNG